VVKSFVCPADEVAAIARTDSNGITAGFTSYLGVAGGRVGDGPMRAKHGPSFFEITDGLSQTLLTGERPPPATLTAGWWYAANIDGSWPGAFGRGPDGASLLQFDYSIGDQCPSPSGFQQGLPSRDCDRIHFWSLHAGGANFAMCDGSVRFFAYSPITQEILVAMASIAGGEKFQE
jgi:prepilin-type processing-associated H-X9-DG protein